MIEELTPYLIGWRGYFGFCQTPQELTKLEAWIRRNSACIFGGSGGTGTTASRNSAAAACRSSGPRLPPVPRRGSGACQDTRRSNRPCATTTSTPSVSLNSMSPPKFNPVEPPWYGPVCPVVWEGRHREVSPYPDQPHVSRTGPGLAAHLFAGNPVPIPIEPADTTLVQVISRFLTARHLAAGALRPASRRAQLQSWERLRRLRLR